jgi:thiamine-phosphate pyrophosphorylase
VVLTDREQCARHGRTVLDTVREAVSGGARAVLVREKDLSPGERRALVDGVRSVLEPLGGRVGIASDVSLAASAGIDWVHLAQRDPLPRAAGDVLLGRSCHDVHETVRARGEGCGYATLSPVALTVSKPGYGPALGAGGVDAGCRAAAPMPVWALGGVTPENSPAWLAAGAFGVAVMGSIMGAVDPAAVTAEYLEALGAGR